MSLLKQKIELGIAEAEMGVEQKLSQYPKPLKWFLILGVLATIPAYFTTKSISHNYWQKKYQSSLIIAKPSFESPLELKVKNIQLISYGNGSYAAWAEITNENLDLSSQNISYKFTFGGEGGKTILPETGSDEGSTFILPNKSKFIFVPKILSGKKITSVKLEVGQGLKWQKKISVPKITLLATVPKSSQQTDPQVFIVEGALENQSPYNLKTVKLSFLVYNSLGQIIAVSERSEFDLQSGERRTYKQLWPNFYLPGASYVQVVAETNALDPNNLSLVKGQSGPSSDLSRPDTGN